MEKDKDKEADDWLVESGIIGMDEGLIDQLVQKEKVVLLLLWFKKLTFSLAKNFMYKRLDVDQNDICDICDIWIKYYENLAMKIRWRTVYGFKGEAETSLIETMPAWL